MHNISRKYFSQQIFQYSNKHKNFKKKKKKKKNKGRQIKNHEKRCVENAKILKEICEKNTQHDMINQ
jgi:hypothetical protein